MEKNESHAREIEIPDLLESAKKAQPLLSGLLQEKWGHQKNWPEDRWGTVVMQKLKDAIRAEEERREEGS